MFDFSADYKGKCLNKKLLSGLDLTNQIFGALLIFRGEQIAIMGAAVGDIKAMLHQKVLKDP